MTKSNKPTIIRVLFLDIGGVVLTNGWDRHGRAAACAAFGLDREEFDERHGQTFDTYEEGKISLETYLDRVVFHTPRDFTVHDFKQFMYSQSRPVPKMIDLLARVVKRYGLRVGAISNEGRELTEYRVKRYRLGELIDFFICSCFVHFRKPDEDIFRMALDIAQAEPRQAAYIDDRHMHVEVARTMGIASILHTSVAATTKELARLALTAD